MEYSYGIPIKNYLALALILFCRKFMSEKRERQPWQSAKCEILYLVILNCHNNHMIS